MSTALFPSPGAGFDQPFEMLAACHDRVRRSLDLLLRLQAHLAAHGADGQAQGAARDVMRYFDLAAPAHHEDEERHVFPALLAADRAAHEALVERLRQDHRAMAEAWATLRPGLQAVAEGRWSGAETAGWAAFVALYEDHARAEDDRAFPAARALFGAADQAAMGREMAARRGLTAVNTGR